MKTLFIGGIKSGKSLLAEKYILKNYCNQQKPIYLATTEFIDEEIEERIQVHKKRREANFITLEEPLDLYSAINNTQSPVLVECTSMWINNMLYHNETKEQILEHIKTLMQLDHDIVFVHNDVGCGIIPDNALAREYIDISGIVSQIIATGGDEVYHCIAGIATRIK